MLSVDANLTALMGAPFWVAFLFSRANAEPLPNHLPHAADVILGASEAVRWVGSRCVALKINDRPSVSGQHGAAGLKAANVVG